MNDLIWFLSEDFQFELKEKAQCDACDRFENVLSNYCRLFIDELSSLKSAHDIGVLKEFPSENKHKLYDWADLNYDKIKKNINVYEKLFEAIIYTYKLFLKGKHFHATLHLFDILEEYEIVDALEPKDLGLFYKGRKVDKGVDIKSVNFFYHIPFDERYRVSNQRFSVSGQPILYLDSSILDVLYELRSEINSYPEIAIASFSFDSIIDETINSIQKPIKIYDITNQILKLFYEKMAPLNHYGLDESIDFNNLDFDIDKQFKKFILMHLCTFRIKEGRKFVEEYVLGQLLTEALRINNYDGIKYPSTQFDIKDLRFYMFSYSAVKENLALFTKYSESEKYDYKLLERFLIQPLHELTGIKTIKEYQQQIKYLLNAIFIKSFKICGNDPFNQFENASSCIAKIYKCECYSKVNDMEYFTLPFAKIELQSQMNFLQNILERLNTFERQKQKN